MNVLLVSVDSPKRRVARRRVTRVWGGAAKTEEEVDVDAGSAEQQQQQ